MTGPDGDPRPGDQPGGDPGAGSIADELHRLVGEMTAWAGVAASEAHALPTGPECGWCPVCQFAELLRGDHPEASERVKQAGAAIVAAFRAVMQAASQEPLRRTGPPAETPEPPGPDA
ncbi:MAG: hypothetical protein ACTHMS_08850 [Jatrophihabitans sp.]|uniref:hypothetical protein n=1 Tax=Jatrophihabitans sp. TaxID=1932789 RepID=UPI003F7CEF8C